MNYLASPPLCVAYALAGRMDLDLYEDPLGEDTDGKPVYLRDIWPTQAEVNEAVESAIESDMFRKSYGEVFEGDENWNGIDIPEGDRYEWGDDSTYVKRPPYFDGMPADAPEGFDEIKGAKAIAKLGDSVTTDHISPAGAIKRDTPGGKYLLERDVEQKDFNSYGSRRGNHEVMMRGTFANVRLRNQLAPGTEGWLHEEGRRGDVHLRRGDGVRGGGRAHLRTRRQGVRLRLVARLGREGPAPARHQVRDRRELRADPPVEPRRDGRAPLQFPDGEDAESLGLSGFETFDLAPVEDGARTLKVTATPADGGDPIEFDARVRIDTPKEWLYFRHGGILHYVLRQLLTSD